MIHLLPSASDVLGLISSLKTCIKLKDLETVKRIHGSTVARGETSDVYVATTLVDAYAKCGSMSNARSVFDGILHPNVVSWNALMHGYADNGEGGMAIQLLARMHASHGCVPNARTLVAALKACACFAADEDGEMGTGEEVVKVRSMQMGLALHSQAAISSTPDAFVENSLVSLYASCGEIVVARRVFDQMPNPGTVSSTVMISGYAELGDGIKALECFACMRCAPDSQTFVAVLKALVVKESDYALADVLNICMAIHSRAAYCDCDFNRFVANTLVDLYASCRRMDLACMVFNRMEDRDVVSWNAMMFGYVGNREGWKVLELYKHMSCEPNALTLVAALSGCGIVADLQVTRRVQCDVRRRRLEGEPRIVSALVDAYGKCGSMEDAQEVFDASNTRDLVNWTSLLAGYSRQGDTRQVFSTFHRMQDLGLKADRVTFQCVLTACSHAGLVQKGMEIFEAFEKVGMEMEIEHYHSMIDLLGRSNRLEAALAMVRKMPFKPNAVTWRTLLSACKKWKNLVIAELAFQCLITLEKQDSNAYILMASVYRSWGMREEEAKVEAMEASLLLVKPANL